MKPKMKRGLVSLVKATKPGVSDSSLYWEVYNPNHVQDACFTCGGSIHAPTARRAERQDPGQSVGAHRKADGRSERYRSVTCRHTTWGERDQSYEANFYFFNGKLPAYGKLNRSLNRSRNPRFKSQILENILTMPLYYRDYNDHRDRYLHKYHSVPHLVCVFIFGCIQIHWNSHIYTAVLLIYKYILISPPL